MRTLRSNPPALPQHACGQQTQSSAVSWEWGQTLSLPSIQVTFGHCRMEKRALHFSLSLGALWNPRSGSLTMLPLGQKIAPHWCYSSKFYAACAYPPPRLAADEAAMETAGRFVILVMEQTHLW